MQVFRNSCSRCGACISAAYLCMLVCLAGAPLARGSCRDRDPIRALFLRPGSGSQLFLGLSGSNLWFPGGSELNCAPPGPRTTTNLTTYVLHVCVLNYESQHAAPLKAMLLQFICPCVLVHIFNFSADRRFWTGPRRIFRSIFGIFWNQLDYKTQDIPTHQLKRADKVRPMHAEV